LDIEVRNRRDVLIPLFKEITPALGAGKIVVQASKIVGKKATVEANGGDITLTLVADTFKPNFKVESKTPTTLVLQLNTKARYDEVLTEIDDKFERDITINVLLAEKVVYNKTDTYTLSHDSFDTVRAPLDPAVILARDNLKKDITAFLNRYTTATFNADEQVNKNKMH